MNGDIDIIFYNMPSENFNDAIFFLKEGEGVSDEFVKRRYFRASSVFFCATVETWARELVIYCLKNKENISKEEKKLLEQLVCDNEKIPHITTKELLHVKLPELCKVKIDDCGEEILNKYKELTTFRNDFIHYSERYSEKQYDICKIEELLKKAPENIGQLLNIFVNLEEMDWYHTGIQMLNK